MGFVDGDRTLGGLGGPIVEVDKTFIGGYDRQGHDDKKVVLGMIERAAGRYLPGPSRAAA
jgi:hypothetical protein